MKYNSDDLSQFITHIGTEQLDASPYFELHPNDLQDPYIRQRANSLHITHDAFDFFAMCFECEGKPSNYFAFARYGQQDIQIILHKLETFLNLIKAQPTRTHLFTYYYWPDSTSDWDDVATSQLAPAIIQCAQNILTFIQEQTKKSGCLWFYGL